MDQALQNAYNKPPKGPGGVISFSNRKEAVAQWNRIKHRKAQFTFFVLDLCQLNDDREYSLHHEFSEAIAWADEEAVEQVTTFIAERQNPCDMSGN